MSRREELRRFAELSEWIRELSSPSLEGIGSPQEYNRQMGENYGRMRELNDKSTKIIETILDPMLGEETETEPPPLTAEEAEDLFDFCDVLYDPLRRESVDDLLRYRVVRRLLRDAEEKDDIASRIRALGILMECCACIVIITVKLYPESGAVNRYRAEGLEAAERLRGFLEPEAFAALPDDRTRETVLKSTRELWSLFAFRKAPWSAEENETHLTLLKEALALAENPFYIEHASKYDWKNHRYRVLQGIASLTEYHNAAGLTAEQLTEINTHSRQLLALWKEDKVLQGALSSSAVLHLAMYRNAYLTGEMPLADYREHLLRLLAEADDEDYSYDGNMRLVMTQTEYLLTLKGEKLTEEEETQVIAFFDRTVRYLRGMPKLGSLTSLITALTRMLEAFADCGLNISFANLCAQLLAAINPPTYRHCLVVSELSARIASHLFDREPSMFAKVDGYPEKEKVLFFVRQAGLLHDSGKIWVAEAVTSYARYYVAEEENMFMIYPAVGASMLARFPETAPYAEIIRHHREERWDHDIVTQIVAYADQMSRVSKEGDSTDRANIPYLDALCKEEEIRAELKRVVEEGNERCTEEIFRMLRRDTEEA